MSSKSVKQKCQARVSRKECQERVSSKSVKKECRARVSSKSVKQECLEKSVKKECPARVSSKSVKQECLEKSVKKECQARECFQECPARRCWSLMTVRVIPTKKRHVFSFLRSFLCTLLYIKWLHSGSWVLSGFWNKSKNMAFSWEKIAPPMVLSRFLDLSCNCLSDLSGISPLRHLQDVPQGDSGELWSGFNRTTPLFLIVFLCLKKINDVLFSIRFLMLGS